MRQFENPFLFYLIDPITGNYWTLVSGVPTLTATPTYLTDPLFAPNEPQAPDGWRDMEITWARSPLYWGLFRNFTTEFNFKGEASTIITYLHMTQGSTAKARLLIRKRDMANVGGSVALVDYYSGDLDFNKCVPTFYGVSIPIKEQGLRDLFTQNEAVTYEIPITGAGSVLAGLYGFTLKATKRYVMAASAFQYTPRTLIPPTINFSADDGDFSIGEDQFVDWSDTTIWPSTTPTSDMWFFKSNRTQTSDFIYNINIGLDYSISNVSYGDAQLSMSLQIYADDTMATLVNSTIIWQEGNITPFPPGTSFPIQNFTGSIVHTLNEGNVAILRLFINPVLTGVAPVYTNNWIYLADGDLTIYSDFQLPFTSVMTLYENVVFEQIVDKMTDGQFAADSTFLTTSTDWSDSNPTGVVYTNGDAIRNRSNFTGVPDKLKTTPRDVFKNLMTDYGCGITLDGGFVTLMRLEKILNPALSIIHLGEISAFEVPNAEELLNNYIESGNNEYEYDGLNGRDEFMNKSKWKTALTNPQTLDLVRPFRYDAYGIETARYKLFDKNTTDNNVDNDIFVVEADPSTIVSGAIGLRRDQNLFGNVAIGVLSPSGKYNISKSPLRVMERNAPFIKGMMYFNQGGSIAFQSTEKNENLATLFSGVSKLEKDPIIPNVSPDFDTTTPLFVPLLFKGKVRIPANLFEIVNANPNGYMSFTYRGYTFKGFPMNIGMKPVTNDQYEVVLLAHPDTDPLDIFECLKHGI